MKSRAALLIVLSLCGSCTSTQQTETELQEQPSFKDLVNTHNARLARLDKLYAVGVIEIRWQDDNGKHFEQGNLDLWLDRPRHTAVRMEKLGEVLMWLGSDSDRFWLFDLLADESVLYTGNHGQQVTSEELGGLAFNPLILLDMLALSSLTPVHEADSHEVTFDREHEAWVVTAWGQGALNRVYFSCDSGFPVRVEALSDDGEVLVHSTLSRYESVPLQGMTPVGYPKLAELIDIEGESESEYRGQLKIALGQATGIVGDQPFDRVFDLKRLTHSLQPQRIETLAHRE